jgi:hypothetical protein
MRPDMQDEQLREAFLVELQQLFEQPDADIWFAEVAGSEGDPRPRKSWDKRGSENVGGQKRRPPEHE